MYPDELDILLIISVTSYRIYIAYHTFYMAHWISNKLHKISYLTSYLYQISYISYKIPNILNQIFFFQIYFAKKISHISGTFYKI